MDINEKIRYGSYILAIDGGGTKTVILAADCVGTIMARLEAGPLNMNGQKEETVQKMLLGAFACLKQQGFAMENCMQIGIGTAGISNPVAAGLLKKICKRAGFLCEPELFGDHETALAAAFPSCKGCILIAGTGSVCMGTGESGILYRAGGYGHLIDDGGSAYFIGREILSAVVQSEDCRAKKTLLVQMVFEHLQIKTTEEMIRWIYQENRTKSDIASLAVLCGAAAEKMDITACGIQDRSADELVKLAKAVLHRIPEEHNLVFAGSVLLKNKEICRRTKEQMLLEFPHLHVKLAEAESAEGTLRLLLKKRGRQNEKSPAVGKRQGEDEEIFGS